MGSRKFTDLAGVAWEVWEAHPTLIERRHLRDRRAVARDTPERRTMDTPLSTLVRDSRGWLAFRSAFERRRTPIPERWEELSDTGLRAALHGSRLAGPIQRPNISLQELTSTFTAGVLQQLHRALAADLASAAGDPGSLRDAMLRLAAEAHVRHLGHQETVDGVTGVWHSLAVRQPLAEDQKRATLGRVLSACAQAYYEPR